MVVRHFPTVQHAEISIENINFLTIMKFKPNLELMAKILILKPFNYVPVTEIYYDLKNVEFVMNLLNIQQGHFWLGHLNVKPCKSLLPL